MTKKILIVEDEDTILELCSIIFVLENFKVLCARDGEEALKIMKKDDPDIILLDIQIPKLNGIELCRLIKSDPVMSHTKVLMLSGVFQDSDYQEALRAGADAYINKPFVSKVLVNKVAELLDTN